jgi:transketolase
MIDKKRIDPIEKKVKEIRKNIVKMIKPPKGGHLGGSMSCAEIIGILYYYKMNHDPKNPDWEKRDRLILSKGHSCLAQYAALYDFGYMGPDEINNIKELSCNLQGHPDINKTVGIEANTGSLGQGLSIGVGMCLGSRIDNINYNVYVVLGDGELQEGQVWEAAMSAAHYKINNIIAIVDDNKQESSGFTEDRLGIGNISSKWESFGWKVFEVDGHDLMELAAALDKADGTGAPVCIIANTIKGKGVSIAEGKTGYHKAVLDDDTYNSVLSNL